MLAYVYAVFDLPSISLLLLAVLKLIPKSIVPDFIKREETIGVVWHYFGLLSIVIIWNYLFGYTQFYELGYSYLGLVFLVPIMFYALVRNNIVLCFFTSVFILVWLVFDYNYINLLDVISGELFFIVYLLVLFFRLLTKLYHGCVIIIQRVVKNS